MRRFLLIFLHSFFLSSYCLSTYCHADSSLEAWGRNTDGECNVPDGNDYKAIATGQWHGLAIKSDDSIVGWGQNNTGQATPPAGNEYKAISAGGYHGIALKTDGSIAGWGYNLYGQATPPDGNNYIAIGAGFTYSLALTSDGSIIGWGDDSYGQLEFPKDNDYVAIAAGFSFGIALKSNGSIIGWGYNSHGQASPPAGSDYVSISAGGTHALALKSDGSIVGWGDNAYGQATPPAGNNYISIAAGAYHSAALKSDGTITAWGRNNFNQAAAPAGNNYTNISAGGHYSLCQKNTNSTVYQLTTNVIGGQGTITPSAGTYNSGTLIHLQAKPDLGYRVKAWTGTDKTPASGSNNNDVTINSDKTVTVEFQVVHLFGNISGKTNTKLTVKDPCGVPVTLRLTGGGYGEVYGDANDQITLYNTTEKSILTISIPKGKISRISNIYSNGSLKAITAKQTDLDGNIIVKGPLGTLTLKNAKGSISIGSPIIPNPKAAVTIVFDVADGLKIDSDMPIKSIKATSWQGIELNAPSVGSITIKGDKKRGIAGQAEGTISIGSSSNPKAAVTMVFDVVSDLTIDSNMPIKSITATDWTGGSINAPSVGNITIKGDMKYRGISGDLDTDADVELAIGTIKIAGTLSGSWECSSAKSITALDIDNIILTLTQATDPAGKIFALGKLTAKGYTYESQILSAGNIGTVTFGVMEDSVCFAGVTTTRDSDSDGVLDLPNSATDIGPIPATIKSIKVNGTKSDAPPYFTNSNIAAANILSGYIAYPNDANSIPDFGIAAGYIKSLKIKDSVTTYSSKDLKEQSNVTYIPKGSFKILLY